MKAVKGKYYFGGVHPKGAKELSASAPLEVMPVPELLAISLSKSLGKPAVPCVTAGQAVREGEIIAKADGAISSDVFASAAGTIEKIAEETGVNGVKETFIYVKPTENGEKAYFPALKDPSAEEIKERIRECGIVGLGGAGFPTAVKVSPKTPVDTLILNGAECEPYLTCDHRLMLEKTDDIVRGARYLAKALGVANIIIGIEANKPDAIALFEPYEDIKVVILKKQYPMGGERQLAYVTTGRRIGAGKLPADLGLVVQNVGTAYAVCEAVELGKPLYERVVTVSGKAVKEPKNVWVRVGTPIKDIIAYCGGENSSPVKAVLGGPMTGVAVADYESYTHKTTSGVLLLTAAEAETKAPTPCLNCGKCADVCPMHLMPMNTAFYSAAGDFEAAAKYGHVASCIECGACEYIFPAKRPLIQAIRKTKAELRNKK